jgi:hypothetical protein
MTKFNVNKTKTGFKISKSQEQISKELIFKRISERKYKSGKVTNEELFEAINDLTDLVVELLNKK